MSRNVKPLVYGRSARPAVDAGAGNRETVEIEEMLRAALDSATVSSPNRGGIVVSATRSDLAADLRSFGELTIAGRIASLSEAKLRAIFERAGQLNQTDPNLARVLCLAAVEIVDGKASRPEETKHAT